jgi:hypothetical protein
MQLRALAEISSSVANPDNAHLRRRYVVAIALSVMMGVGMSIWLAIDSPIEAPTRTSYLPAD